MPQGFDGKPWAADIHLTPDGKYLYASERTSSTLAGFKVDTKTGMLTPITIPSTEKQPRAFNIDPTGRYILAVGELSNSMTSYSIDKANRQAHQAEGTSDGQEAELGRIVAFPRVVSLSD